MMRVNSIQLNDNMRPLAFRANNDKKNQESNNLSVQDASSLVDFQKSGTSKVTPARTLGQKFRAVIKSLFSKEVSQAYYEAALNAKYPGVLA